MTHKKFKLGKNGFTLIELLAVLVVLAIIALIAIPILLKVVKDSEDSSKIRSVELYSKAVENAIAKYSLNKSKSSANCNIDKDEVVCIDNDQEKRTKIEYKGSKVECKETTINPDGTFYLKQCYVNGEFVDYEYGTKKMFKDGDIVYFDVLKGVGCSEKEYDITNSYTNYNGIDKHENTQTNCLKFYSFGDIGTDEISLILDHNTTANAGYVEGNATNGYPSNKSGPINALNKLKEATNSWNGTIEPKKYTLRQTNYANYDINYSGYKARLITAQEVAKITGNIDFDESVSKDKFYFDSNSIESSSTCNKNDIKGCKYGWLYDRTGTDCKEYGCLNNSNIKTFGYWTSTSQYGSNATNWCVGDGSSGLLTIGGTYLGNSWYAGAVRPVIEVSKDKLK